MQLIPAIKKDGALVVDQAWEGKAIDFVRQKKLRANVIQGSFCLKNLKVERTPSDSIIHELVTCLGPRIPRIFVHEEKPQHR